MKMNHVAGKKSGHLMLYALSTCIWCKKTKNFLNNLGVEYTYVDVDLLAEKEKDEATKEIMQWNPSCSFPTLVVNNKKCIVGYKEKEIKQAIET